MKEWILPVIGTYLTLASIACSPKSKIDPYYYSFPEHTSTPIPRFLTPTPTEIVPILATPYTGILSEEEVVRGFVEALIKDDITQAASFIPQGSINEASVRKEVNFIAGNVNGCTIGNILKALDNYIVSFTTKCGLVDSMWIDLSRAGERYYVNPLKISLIHSDIRPVRPSTPAPSRLP